VAVEVVALAVDGDGAAAGGVQVGRLHQRVGERGLVHRRRQVLVHAVGGAPGEVPARLVTFAAEVTARRGGGQFTVGDADAEGRRLLAQLGDGELLVEPEGAFGLGAIEAREPQLRVGLAVALLGGLERSVRTQFPLDRIPIVVWTGAYEPESIGDLLDTPHVLHKPAASDELLEVVRRALGDETKSRALRVLVVSQSTPSLRGIVG